MKIKITNRLLLIFSFFIFLFTIECNAQHRNPKRIKIAYDTLNIVNKSSEFYIYNKDSLSITLTDGFDNDSVSIRIDKKNIYNKKIATSITTGCAGWINIPRSKQSKTLELKINKGKWLTVNIIYRFNYIYISYPNRNFASVIIANQAYVFQ